MDIKVLGVAVAIVGLGVNIAIRIFDMNSLTKKIVGGGGIALIVIGVGGVLYSLVVGGEPEGKTLSVPIEQTNPYQSPNVVGDNTQFNFNFNSEQQPWHIRNKESFIQSVRQMGPITFTLSYMGGNGHAKEFCLELAKALTDGGWTLKDNYISGVQMTEWEGVIIRAKSPGKHVLQADRLRALLKLNDVVVKWLPAAPQAPDDMFSIAVGYKPGLE